MRTRWMCVVLAIILVCSSAFAQWVQTNGPNGGHARCFATSGTGSSATIFAGCSGGVFRSTDLGGHWTLASSGLAYADVFSLAVNGSFVFASIPGYGVYRSSNDGASWASVNSGLSTLEVWALCVNGSDLFAGTWRGGAFRSTNNGNSWVAVNNGLTNNEVGALAAYPDGAGGSCVFAGTRGGGVFRSTDDGEHWTATNAGIWGEWVYVYSFAVVSGEGAHPNLYTGTNYGTYRSTDNGDAWGEYNNGITTSYILSLAGEGQTIFAGTADMKGVFLSLDGGVSWNPINNGIREEDVYAICLIPGAGGTGGLLIAGIGSEGIFGTTDNGAHWTDLNDGFVARSVPRLAVCDNALFGSSGSDVFRSTDEGTNWTNVGFGLVGSGIEALLSVPSPGGAGDPYLYAGTNGDGVYRSTDLGVNWTHTSSGIETFYMRCLAALPASTGGDVYIYAGDGSNVVRSTNYGANWTVVNTGLPGKTIYAFTSTTAPGNGGATTIFTGTFGSGVYLSTNDGGSWTAANTGLTNLYVSTLAAVPAPGGSGGTILLAGTSGGLFRSTNNGGSWILASSLSFFCSYPYTFLVVGSNLYAATRAGTYGSTDFGTTWIDLTSGLGYRWVYSLALIGPTLFAGTPGNGVWRRSIDEIPLPITLASFTGTPTARQGGVLLEWKTVSEVNNYGYTVQRKSDGEFADLPGAFIAGKGTTAEPQSYSYVDRSIMGAGTYTYRLKQHDVDGTLHYSPSVIMRLTSADVSANPPEEFRLMQNNPNPFNPSTTIEYTVGATANQPSVARRVRLAVYDLLGREVAVLSDEQRMPGRYLARFNATGLASGVYIYRITAGEYVSSKKMVLTK
jgi:hypothetical protein